MGHLVTADGISSDPLKVEAIQTLAAPTDVSAVRRLCGTVQYLARYIPNLSEHLELLRALTRNKADWNWTKECQQAFDNIKKNLWSMQQSCPILTTRKTSPVRLTAVNIVSVLLSCKTADRLNLLRKLSLQHNADGLKLKRNSLL
ncbi:polyprotein [Elysia marginata]|uniref:Polyprotein n=1 Tax=Elysia marginata TaxID=1093978 RepID=A0AAV4HEM8_9GAST|nr:polyprotein [Elysia marginata]